ncbi:E3 ubiquitin-protein ligase NEURL1B-like [Styela clava]
MGNNKSQHHSKYSESASKRQRLDYFASSNFDGLSAASIRAKYPNPVRSTPLRFHRTHGVNITITYGGRVASRGNSFCYAIAFSSRPINVEERVKVKLKTVQRGWSGAIRFGFTTNDPASMETADLPRYACPDLTNRKGYWAKAMPEQFAEQGSIVSFYVNTSGTVFFSVNDELQGTILESVDVTSPLWALFDVYGNTTSLELVSRMEDQIVDIGVNDRNSSGMSTLMPVHLPSDMPRFAREKLCTDEHIIPMTFSATMGKQLKCRNLIQLTRKDDVIESSLAFTSTALKAGQTAYFYCAQTKPHHLPMIEEIGFGVGITTCDPSSIPINELPFDSTMIMDRSEYWILFRDFEPPRETEYFAFTVEKGGCLTYTREGGQKTVLFHMDVSQPLYVVLDMCSKVSCLAIVGMSTQLEIENDIQESYNNLDGYTSILDNMPTFDGNSSMSRTHSLLHEMDGSTERPIRPASESFASLMLPRTTSGGPRRSPMAGISISTAREESDAESESQMSSGIYPHGGDSHTSGVYPHENATNSSEGGSSGAVAVAMAAAPVVVSAISWLGNTMVNRWNQNTDSGSGNREVVNETSSSDSSSSSGIDGDNESEEDLESGEDMFFNANDTSRSNNDSDEDPSTQLPRLLEMLDADLTELLRPLDLAGADTGMNTPGTSRISQEVTPSLTVPKEIETTTSKDEEKQTTDTSGKEKQSTDTSDKECVICCDAFVNTVMYSCGHACLCYECGQVILSRRNPNCPICRADVKDIIRVYPA